MMIQYFIDRIAYLHDTAPWLVTVSGLLLICGFFLSHLGTLHPIKHKLPLALSLVELICAPLAFLYTCFLLGLLLSLDLTLSPGQWPKAGIALVFSFIVSWYLAKLTHAFIVSRYIATRGETSQTLSGLVRGAIYVSCILMGVGIFLWQQGYSFTGVWVSTGLATALIGFALQQTLGDFFSGLALGLEGSFRIGDRLRLEDDTEGAVIDINWRATWLHDWDNTTHIIPNSKLAKQGFTNLGNEFHYYHPWYTIQLPADIDPRFAKQLLIEGVYRCRHVLKHPPPVVRLMDASKIPYTYMCWVFFPNYPAMFRGREELYREIHYVLKKAGVSPAATTMEWRTRRADIPVAEPPTIQLALKSQEIFSNLSDEEIENLALLSQQLHYDLDSPIELEQGEVDALDIIISGIVEVFIELADGRKKVVEELGPGQSHGLVSMFTDTPIGFQRTAQTDVTLIRINLESMQKLLQQHPELTDFIAAVVKRRQDEAEHLRMQVDYQADSSSLQEIKTYIRQMIGKRRTTL